MVWKTKRASADTGYRRVWDVGKSASVKRRQRISGKNRPST